MKKLFLFLFLSSSSFAAGPIISTVQISTTVLSTQSGGYNVQKGTHTVGFSLPYISGVQCLHTNIVGDVVGTGADCGSGTGGGSSGTIVGVASQYAVPYYPVTGSSNTLGGLSAGTAGQILSTQGGSGPPQWINANSAPYAVQPATVPFNLAQGVTGTTFTFTGPAQSTITYGVTVGSITLPSLAANQCLQTNGSSQIITTGSGCFAAGSFIQNQSTLQAGATAYPDFLYVGTSVTIPLAYISSATIKNLSVTYGITSGTSTQTVYSSAPVMYTPKVSNAPNATWNLELYNGLLTHNALSLTDDYVNGTVLKFGGKSSANASLQTVNGMSDLTGFTGNSVQLGLNSTGVNIVSSTNSAYALNVGTTAAGPYLLSVTTNGVVSIPKLPNAIVGTSATGVLISTTIDLGSGKITGILPVANGGSGTASPGLVAGTNIASITGSWPNQTINASGGGGGSISTATVVGGLPVTGVLLSSNSTIQTEGPLPYAYSAHTNSMQAQDMSYAAQIPVAALAASSLPYQLVGTNGGGNTFSAMANMNAVREYQSCTPVDSRGLACCGGGNAAGSYTNTCDLIHDGIVSAMPNMGFSKDTLLLAQLPNGNLVQAFGGGASFDSGSQVIFTTGAVGSWSIVSIGNVNTASEQGNYSLLNTGYPMYSGGQDSGANYLTRTEILTSTGGWVLGPSLNTGRANHMQVTLDDGRVMICGGQTASATATNSCEFCDIAFNKCVVGPSMISARELFGYAKLKNGNIYVAGGYNNNPTVVATAEVFNVALNVWQVAPSMAAARQSGINFCARDPNGNVLCGGGRADNGSYLSSFDLFNPYAWTDTATASYPFIISNHSINSMPNGQIIVTGGQNSGAAVSSTTYYSALTMENKTVTGTQITINNSTGTLNIALPSSITQAETFTTTVTVSGPMFSSNYSSGTIAASTATASATFIPTGLKCTITPQSPSSVIKVCTYGIIEATNSGGAAFLTIARGSTNLGDSSYGFSGVNAGVTGDNVPISACTMDSPNTVSATTYNVEIVLTGAVGSATFCSTGKCNVFCEEEH